MDCGCGASFARVNKGLRLLIDHRSVLVSLLGRHVLCGSDKMERGLHNVY